MVIAQQEAGVSLVTMAAMVSVGLLTVGAGYLVIWSAKLAASGEIKRNNGWAGIRTRATASSDEAWLAAHQEAEALTVWGGWVFMASAILAPVLALVLTNTDEQATTVWGIGLTIGIVAGTGFVMLAASRGNAAAKEVEQHDRNR